MSRIRENQHEYENLAKKKHEYECAIWNKLVEKTKNLVEKTRTLKLRNNTKSP